MKTLVTIEPRRVEFRDAPEPSVGPDDALLAVETVGICGSDIHLLTGEHPYSQFPIVQGHEFAGRVLSLPGDYEGDIRAGDRVAVEPLLTCGTCLPCRRGRGNCCVNMRTFGVHVNGALAERIAVPVRSLHAAPGLSAELAALVEPVSIGLHAVVRSGATSGDTVVVFGAGPIGQAILLAALDVGARLLIVDRVPNRLKLALELGADVVVDSLSEPAAERIAAWTSGEGPVIVFEATGAPAVLELAIDAVAPSGTVVVVGLSKQSVLIPMSTFTRKELDIVGSRNNLGDFAGAADLIVRNQDRVAKLITHQIPFADAQAAFDLALNQPSATEKVVITMDSDH